LTQGLHQTTRLLRCNGIRAGTIQRHGIQ
jgi:hypothetical protein